MLRQMKVVTLAWALLCSSAFASESGRAVNESVAASGHMSGSVAHALAASGQVAFAVSAVPIGLSVLGAGAVIVGIESVGESAKRAAAQPIGSPLPVCDETVSAAVPKTPPPNQALKPRQPQTAN